MINFGEHVYYNSSKAYSEEYIYFYFKELTELNKLQLLKCLWDYCRYRLPGVRRVDDMYEGLEFFRNNSKPYYASLQNEFDRKFFEHFNNVKGEYLPVSQVRKYMVNALDLPAECHFKPLFRKAVAYTTIRQTGNTVYDLCVKNEETASNDLIKQIIFERIQPTDRTVSGWHVQDLIKFIAKDYNYKFPRVPVFSSLMKEVYGDSLKRDIKSQISNIYVLPLHQKERYQLASKYFETFDEHLEISKGSYLKLCDLTDFLKIKGYSPIPDLKRMIKYYFYEQEYFQRVRASVFQDLKLKLL